MGVVNAEQDIAEVLSDGKSCSIDPSCHVCGDVAVVANVTLANQRWLGQLLNQTWKPMLGRNCAACFLKLPSALRFKRSANSVHSMGLSVDGSDALIARQFF